MKYHFHYLYSSSKTNFIQFISSKFKNYRLLFNLQEIFKSSNIFVLVKYKLSIRNLRSWQVFGRVTMNKIDFKKLRKDLLNKVAASGIVLLVKVVEGATEQQLLGFAKDYQMNISEYTR